MVGLERCAIPSSSFEECIKRNRHTTMMELAEACKNENFVVFASRNDEDNTKYSVKLYEYINQNNPDDILCFSLKADLKEFENMYPAFTAIVDDTQAISIEELVYIVKNRNKSSKVSMVVIDYLLLMTTRKQVDARIEEMEYLLSKLKQLSLQENLSILVLLPLSKYAPSNYSIEKELEAYYGKFISYVDFMTYVASEMNSFMGEVPE